MNNTVIIEFPSNLGLKEPTAGHQPGVRHLPDFLRKHNFHSTLKAEKVECLDPPVYSMTLDPESKVRNADKIVEYARFQSTIIESNIINKKFPLVLGGDCSILIGNSLALKRMGSYGLFFLDGHTDFMWPELSQTGGAAGMDLAIVTGYGHDKLTNIDQLKPYFKEQHVWCVGNREYEDWYIETILKSEINYYDLEMLRKQGVKNCVDNFLSMVRFENLDGYWIHVDVDVLNDNIMPAVDSRQPDGLNYNEFNELLDLLLNEPKAVGLEITILDPELDPTGKYTQQFVNNFCDVYNTTIKGYC